MEVCGNLRDLPRFLCKPEMLETNLLPLIAKKIGQQEAKEAVCVNAMKYDTPLLLTN